MMPSLEDIRELFRTRDLRCTRQREVIYGALAATKTHPTAEELHQSVLEAEPGLSLATVYNTLDALTAAGLARKFPDATGTGAARYDADTHPHVHAQGHDGRVMDIPADLSDRLLAGLSPDLIRELEARMGVSVRRLNLQVEVDPAR